MCYSCAHAQSKYYNVFTEAPADERLTLKDQKKAEDARKAALLNTKRTRPQKKKKRVSHEPDESGEGHDSSGSGSGGSGSGSSDSDTKSDDDNFFG
jgi:hypothetical protein